MIDNYLYAIFYPERDNGGLLPLFNYYRNEKEAIKVLKSYPFGTVTLGRTRIVNKHHITNYYDPRDDKWKTLEEINNV